MVAGKPLLRYEVGLTGTFTHVASKDTETAQTKERGREILDGTPAFMTRNDPAHRRRVAGASGIKRDRHVGERTHTIFRAGIVPRFAAAG